MELSIFAQFVFTHIPLVATHGWAFVTFVAGDAGVAEVAVVALVAFVAWSVVELMLVKPGLFGVGEVSVHGVGAWIDVGGGSEDVFGQGSCWLGGAFDFVRGFGCVLVGS